MFGWTRGLYEGPDAGAGAAAGTPAASTTDGTTQAGLTSTADAAGAQGDTQGENSGTEKKFSQADLDRIVKERLEREQAKGQKEAEKARKEAEMASLAEQQQFQALAVKRQEQITELEAQLKDLEAAHEKAERYEKALTVYRDALLANVPEAVKELLKGQDIADQLEWLGKNAQQFQPAGQAGASGPIFPMTPAQNGNGAGLSAEEKRRQAYRPRL